jgi:hypothetical protein
MTWRGVDHTIPLAGTLAEKGVTILDYLKTKTHLEDAGCYIYSCGPQTLYVGEALKIGNRVKAHQDKAFVEQADSYRYILPRQSPQRKKMERLLILMLEPTHNKANLTSKGTKNSRLNCADEVLEFIRNEIAELRDDAD